MIFVNLIITCEKNTQVLLLCKMFMNSIYMFLKNPWNIIKLKAYLPLISLIKYFLNF